MKEKGCTKDTVNGHKYLSEVYMDDYPDFKGKFSVPVLYDKEEKKMVNTESGEIIVFVKDHQFFL